MRLNPFICVGTVCISASCRRTAWCSLLPALLFAIWGKRGENSAQDCTSIRFNADSAALVALPLCTTPFHHKHFSIILVRPKFLGSSTLQHGDTTSADLQGASVACHYHLPCTFLTSLPSRSQSMSINTLVWVSVPMVA